MLTSECSEQGSWAGIPFGMIDESPYAGTQRCLGAVFQRMIGSVAGQFDKQMYSYCAAAIGSKVRYGRTCLALTDLMLAADLQLCSPKGSPWSSKDMIPKSCASMLPGMHVSPQMM